MLNGIWHWLIIGFCVSLCLTVSLPLSCLSFRQQPAVSGDVFCLCIDPTAGPADQRLNVRTAPLTPSSPPLTLSPPLTCNASSSINPHLHLLLHKFVPLLLLLLNPLPKPPAITPAPPPLTHTSSTCFNSITSCSYPHHLLLLQLSTSSSNHTPALTTPTAPTSSFKSTLIT